ncbi:MAG TPA: hypothetical protein VGH22_15460 [Candidatus Binatia bacterium]|jgi:hypothetical protein
METGLLFALLISCGIGFVAVSTLLSDLVRLLDKYLKIQARQDARMESIINIVRLQQQLIETEGDQIARIMKAINAERN